MKKIETKRTQRVKRPGDPTRLQRVTEKISNGENGLIPGAGYSAQAGPGAGYPAQAGLGAGYPAQQAGAVAGFPSKAGPGAGYPAQQAGAGAGNPSKAGPGAGYPSQAGPGAGYPALACPVRTFKTLTDLSEMEKPGTQLIPACDNPGTIHADEYRHDQTNIKAQSMKRLPVDRIGVEEEGYAGGRAGSTSSRGGSTSSRGGSTSSSSPDSGFNDHSQANFKIIFFYEKCD